MHNLYIVPLLIAFVLIGLHYLTSQKKVMEKPFMNDWSNTLHILSFAVPFKWFVQTDVNDAKVKDINRLIMEANVSKKMNYRVFITLQISILMISLVAFFVLIMLMDNITFLVSLLFNIDLSETMKSPDGAIKFKFIVGAILLLLCLVPKFWLKRRAKNSITGKQYARNY